MRCVKKRFFWWIYALCISAVALWLCYSTPFFAEIVNKSGVKVVDFENLKKDYLKDNIYYVAESDVDCIRYDSGLFEKLSVSGWAFCETEGDTSNRHVALVFNNENLTYELTPYVIYRWDVPNAVRLQLNRPDMKFTDNTGYSRRFSLLDIRDGIYDIYLCCWENETNHGMADLYRQLIKDGSNVQVVDWIAIPLDNPISATQNTQSLGYLDRVTVEGNEIKLSGWEFALNQDAISQRVYVEITDPNGNVAQYPAKMRTRTDVSTAYNNPLYAQSGYMTIFQGENFLDGTYTIRVFVENGGEVWQSKQYTAIKTGDSVEVQHG